LDIIGSLYPFGAITWTLGGSFVMRAKCFDPTSALCSVPTAESRGKAGFSAPLSGMWC